MKCSWFFAACVLLLGAAHAGAQQRTGGVVGFVTAPDESRLPGVRVTVTDGRVGITRTVTCNVEGWYRVLGLAPGDYELVAEHPGFEVQRRFVSVPLGDPVRLDVRMSIGAFGSVVEVTAMGPQLTQIPERLPIFSDAIQVLEVAPGTVPADLKYDPARLDEGKISSCGSTWSTPYPAWGTPGQRYLSAAGASIAENQYLVDGLNVSNFSQGLGYSNVPVLFVDQVEVTTGGLGANVGGVTGSVINMTTRRGTNTLHGDLHAFWRPSRLQRRQPDTLTNRNQDEEQESLEFSGALGGPIVRDRLFFFLFADYLEDRYVELTEKWGVRYEFSAPYFGARLDWNIGSRHRLEGTWFSDSSEVAKVRFAYDPGTREERDHLPGVDLRGGDSFTLRYTGVPRDNVLLAAQVGRSGYDRTSRSDGDDCPVAFEANMYGIDLWEYFALGCWVNERIGSWEDTRRTVRLDADWFVGRHDLRGGVEVERNTPAALEQWSGGRKYIIAPNEGMYPDLPDDVRLVQTEDWSAGGDFENTILAAYFQDSWTTSPRLTFNMGLRWERQQGSNGLGATVIRAEDSFSPRAGMSWDPAGNGRSLVYANLGTYRMPLPASLGVYFGAAEHSALTVHVLQGGVNSDGSPEGLGELLYSDVFADGTVRDVREVVSRRIQPASQNELIVGYRRALGENWTFGVRGIAHRLERAIEDFTNNQGIDAVYGVRLANTETRIGNPGADFDGYCDVDGDGTLDSVWIPADAMGYPEPERQYYAAEVTIDRRFATRWALHGSYTWSHLYGNYEGLTNSDNGRARTAWRGLSQNFDWPGMLEHAIGDLPNDRRHNLKLFGSYSSPVGIDVAGVLYVTSGRPINSFGFHPDDPWRVRYGAGSFYTDGQPRPRGCCGRTNTVWALDLTLRYALRAAGGTWRAQADIHNVFDNRSATAVDEAAEAFVRVPNANFRQPVAFQPSRAVRIGVGLSF